MNPFRIRTATLWPALCLAGALLLGGSHPACAVLFGPMLQGATATNTYVLAESTSTTPLTVNYGLTTAYGSTASTLAYSNTAASPVTYVHRIKLTGLQPDTLYHYQLVDGATVYPDYTFRTFVLPGSPFRFAWSADFRNGTAVHGQISTRILNSHNTPRPPIFYITGGDYASDGFYASWTSQWLISAELELQKRIPAYMSPGNHEGWGTQMQAYLQAPDGNGPNGYYSFDCGDMHVIMGNYQTSYGSGSAQWNWIQQDLTNSLKPWKIVGFHAPAYTYGGGSSHGNDPTFQSMTTSVLQPGGVKVVFAGHNHFYQHNLVNGVRHLTVGAAGAPLYAVGSDPTYTIRSASTNCYCIGDVTPTNLNMVIYDNAGAVLDTINLVKLPAPAALNATAENLSAALSWPAVPGATSYTVCYGTVRGGPYPSRKTSTTLETRVTGLANGVTYYFVVTATDANGPSGPSVETSLKAIVVPPQITLTSPVEGTVFDGPALIPLSASVVTNGNTINKVQFYRGGTTLLGEDTTPPYAYTWTNSIPGAFALKARLVYNTSSSLDSATANISVIAITQYNLGADRTFTVSGTGVAGRSYVLQSTSSLETPVTWSPVATNTADAAGLFQFTHAAGGAQRFYKVTPQ